MDGISALNAQGNQGLAAEAASKQEAGGAIPSAGADTGPKAPKFSEVWQQIQNNMGAKPEKPRTAKKSLDKDDFMRIMVAQMKNQDPTEPFKPEQFAQQLSQFASIEQLKNLNDSVERIANQQRPFDQLSLMSMIGKNVSVRNDRFVHEEGHIDPLQFSLTKDAAKAKAFIYDAAGEVVAEKDLGPQSAGPVSFSWDGSQSNGSTAKPGNYVFRIEAKDDRDRAIPMNLEMNGKVIGVSFQGKEPMLLVGDQKTQMKVSLTNVAKIETDSMNQGMQQGSNGVLPPVVPKSSQNDLQNTMGAIQNAGQAFGTNGAQPGAGPQNRQDIVNRYAQSGQAASPSGQVGQAPGNMNLISALENGFPNGLASQPQNVAKTTESQTGKTANSGGANNK